MHGFLLIILLSSHPLLTVASLTAWFRMLYTAIWYYPTASPSLWLGTWNLPSCASPCQRYQRVPHPKHSSFLPRIVIACLCQEGLHGQQMKVLDSQTFLEAFERSFLDWNNALAWIWIKALTAIQNANRVVQGFYVWYMSGMFWTDT